MSQGEFPTVSIVTPSLNQAKYLERTIESVISQEGDFHVEYYVIDGGSSDGSVEILQRLANRVRDPHFNAGCRGVRMHWVSEGDRGQTHAINKGLQMITGDYVGYSNSDDTYPPGAFSRLVNAFARYPDADFIHGDGNIVDETDTVKSEWLTRRYNHKMLRSYHFAWNSFPNYIMQQSTFWRRSVLDRIGYLDESMHYAMDLEYWLRAGAQGLRLQHVEEKLGNFRLIEGTKSLSSPTIFWEDQLEIFRRHHGARKLRRYFRYFYFNVALHADYDLDRAYREGEDVFRRWSELPDRELEQLRCRATAGYRDARFLCASKLLSDGDPGRAQQLVQGAPDRGHRAVLNRLALRYRFQRLVGEHGRKCMASIWGKTLAWYRRKWIDYRYTGSGSS